MRPGEQVPSSARLQDFKIGGVRRHGRAPSLVVAVFESGYPTTGAFPCFTPTDLTWGLQGPRWAALPPGAAAIYCGGSSGAGAIGSEARAPLPTAFGVHNIPVFGAPYLSQPVTASATGVVAPSLTRLTGNVQAAVAQMSEPVTAAVAADGATAALAGVAVVGGATSPPQVAPAPAKRARRAATPIGLRAVVHDTNVGAGGDGGGGDEDGGGVPLSHTPTVAASMGGLVLPAGCDRPYFKAVEEASGPRPRYHKRVSLGVTGTPHYKCHYCDYISDRCVLAALCGLPVPCQWGLKWGRTSAATWRSIPSRWRGAVNANVPFLLQMPKFACRITPVCLAGLQREPCSP